jgi:hypothetical protein
MTTLDLASFFYARFFECQPTVQVLKGQDMAAVSQRILATCGSRPSDCTGTLYGFIKILIKVPRTIRRVDLDFRQPTRERTEESKMQNYAWIRARQKEAGHSTIGSYANGTTKAALHALTLNTIGGNTRTRGTVRSAGVSLNKRVKLSEETAAAVVSLEGADAQGLISKIYKKDPKLLSQDEKEALSHELELPANTITAARPFRTEDFIGYYPFAHYTRLHPYGPDWINELGALPGTIWTKEHVFNIVRNNPEWRPGYSQIWGTHCQDLGLGHLAKYKGWNGTDDVYMGLFDLNDPNIIQARFNNNCVMPTMSMYGIVAGVFATPVVWCKYSPSLIEGTPGTYVQLIPFAAQA